MNWHRSEQAWVKAVLQALPQPWPVEAAQMYLRYASDQVRAGQKVWAPGETRLGARIPGRPILRRMFGWTDHAVRTLLKHSEAWLDPYLESQDAEAPPERRQPTARTSPAARQPVTPKPPKGQAPTASRPPADRQPTARTSPHAGRTTGPEPVRNQSSPQPPPRGGGAVAELVPLRGAPELLELGLPAEVYAPLMQAGVHTLAQLRERYTGRHMRAVYGLSKRRWALVEERCQAAGVDLGQPVPRSASSPWIDRAVQGWGALLEAFMAHIGGTPLGMDFMAYVETLVIDDVTDDGTARLVCTSPHLKAAEVELHLVGPLMDVLSGIPDVLGVEVRQMEAVDLVDIKQAEQAGRETWSG